MKQELGLNPWLSIWVKPRVTIRALVGYNTTFRLAILCFIYGFQYMLQASQFMALGESSSLLVIILLAAVLAVPAGYIIFNVMSFFYFLMGKLIKGKGTFKEVRAATYWSSVPLIITVVIWIILMAFHGTSLFVPGYEKELLGAAATLGMVFGIVQIATMIWGFIIFLHALGEVQGFSAWMALLNLFLGGLALFILLFLIGWGVSAFTHVT